VTLEFGILGPLRVTRDGSPVPLGGPRQRAVLARLLLEPRRVVPVDVLVDDVWDDDPPPTATKTLQKYVSGLRAALGADVVRTAGRGYGLDVPDEALDAVRFQRLLAAGDDAGALTLWRGPVLADLPGLRFAAVERTRLDELRLTAVERGLAAELDAGRTAEALPRLAELCGRYPLRERLTGLLMLALYRSGRQVEALQVFATHRHRLVDEVGVDPDDELTALEAAILRHDPGLDLPAPAPARGNLRAPVSTFVGRSAEVAAVADGLPRHRLLTLVGPGGVGKTRVAVEAGGRLAAEFPAGIWWVDLAAIDDPGLVAHAVATTLSVSAEPGQDDEDTVVAALGHRERLLLMLDNCEHLLDRCAALADRIVRSSPTVALLATSRRPLGVDGEYVLPVGPLGAVDAYRLFADRVQQAGTAPDEATHPQLERISSSLDGLPLALELAAAQLRVLGPAELAARLDDRLRFASTRFDAPARQRTLQDMAAWSSGLLPAATQRFFARLGVFATTLPFDAAEAVGGEPDALAQVSALVDHSLLVRDPGPACTVRYRLLDTLRLFALDRLRAAGAEQATRRAHVEFYRALAESAAPHLYGPDEVAWAARLEEEEPNLHAALAWAGEHDLVLALRLAVALWPYWDVQWRERFAVARFTALLAAPGAAEVPDDVRAWALTAMADLGTNPGEARLATGWAREAVALFQRLGDRRGLALALATLGAAQSNEGACDAADTTLSEAIALARGLGEQTMIARGLYFQAFAARRRGDQERSVELSREEIRTWQAIGSRRGEATALRHLAVSLVQQGHTVEGARLCRRALALWEDLGDAASVAHVQTTLADIARLDGDLDDAARRYAEAFVELRRVGDRRCTASTYKNLAAIAAARGQHDRSARLLADAVRVRSELGDSAGLAECFDGLAEDLAVSGRTEDALVLRAAADQRRALSGVAATDEDCATRRRAEAAVPAIPAPRRAELEGRGRAMSVDEAVAFAVDAAGRPDP
jgi:predicted ATPase/DNA-binding SARP family transcriptional activator